MSTPQEQIEFGKMLVEMLENGPDDALARLLVKV